jgi:hypothetical protein
MKVKVTVAGSRPLLQNRYPIEQAQDNETKLKSKDDRPNEETKLKNKSYFDAKDGFYIPPSYITSCLKVASKDYKIPGKGNKTYHDVVKAYIRVEDEKILLHRKDWDRIHREVVRVPPKKGARVPGLWPCWDKWKVTFTLVFNDSRISEDKLKSMLEVAGEGVGFGDHRPEYGLFKIEKWEVIEE